MAKRKKLDHHDDEHIDETWLIPYADLLTLLLALFIVLFSMRSEDSAKSNAMLESLYKAFNTLSVFDVDSGGQTSTNTSYTNEEILPKPIPEQKPADEGSEYEKKLQALMLNLQKYIDEKQLDAVISLTDLQEGIQITLKDTIVFDSGSDTLKSNFVPTLNDIAGMIQTVDNSIIIEGHTDNKPINSSRFPSNWELSAARSLSVLHYFQSIQVDPNRMRFAGYGEFKPIFPNDTPEHREANRRVNIIVLRK